MAQSKHKRHLIKLYIVSSFIFFIGIGVILTGIFVSLDLLKEIEQEGKDLCVLDVNEREDWGDIGGKRHRDLRHQFQIFEVNNSHGIVYGEKPISILRGSYTWEEERKGGDITVMEGRDFKNYTGELFHYVDKVEFYQTGLPNNTKMNDTYTVYNYEAFSMLYSHRMEEDWMLATRALSAMINYTSTQLRDKLILEQMRVDYYPTIYKTEEVFRKRRLDVFIHYDDVDESSYHEFWIDKSFGFKNFNNSLYWGAMCEDRLWYAFEFIHEYFYINRQALTDFLNKFCVDWKTAADKIDDYLSIGFDHTSEARFYRQWALSKGTLGVLGKRSMTLVDPLITGMPEMNVFYDDKFKKTKAIQEQFQSVQFDGVTIEQQRFVKLFRTDNLKVSLFNATNMRSLFELGKTVGIDSRGYYETSKMEPLEKDMSIYTNNELYVIYAYLVNLVEGTFIRNTTDKNTNDKLSMAFSLVDVLKNELQNWRVKFTSKLLTLLGVKYTKLNTCEENSKRFFPNTASSTVCRYKDTWLNTTSGLEFWIRLYIGRNPADEFTDISISDYDKYFLDDKSEWVLFTRSLLDAVGSSEIRNVCANNDDSICSSQELAFSQLIRSYVTKIPIPAIQNQYPVADSYIDFFKLGNGTLTPEISYLGKFQGFNISQSGDVTFNNLVSGMRDSRLFNPFYILSLLNRNCTDIYTFCNPNFTKWLTFMYRNYALPPITKKVAVRDLFNGTDSEYLKAVQVKNPRYGGDPTIRVRYTVLPFDGLYNTNLTWDVFSGSNNADHSRNILKFNDTEEFITVKKTFYHENSNQFKSGVQQYRKNPWRQKVYTAYGTDGAQFVPDLKSNDDLMFYSPFLSAMVRIDYKGIDAIYGLKGDVYKTPVNLYRQESKQKFSLQTVGNTNPYHNYKYDNMFNVSAVFGMSMFATEPMFSIDSGVDVQYESAIYDTDGTKLTDETFFNDHIIVEPYSGIIIRSDTAFQMNFFFDSWYPDGYKQYLMPYVLYQKRADIDGVKARDLFDEIELKDERMKITLVVCIIIGGILFAAGGSIFLLACNRNIQRLHVLKQLQEEEEKRYEKIRRHNKAKAKAIKKREREAAAINRVED